MNSETKHNAEPWNVESGSSPLGDTGDYMDYVLVLAPSDGRTKGYGGNHKDVVADVQVLDFDTAKANADRIVACVNACKGMSDPAKEIAEMRACKEHLARLAGYAKSVRLDRRNDEGDMAEQTVDWCEGLLEFVAEAESALNGGAA